MATKPTPAEADNAAPVATEASTESFPLSLDEFCSRLSQTDRRVELIGGFHHSERAAGHSNDTEAAFAARYVAFCNAPA
jgi:hypothetical protein